MMRSGVVVYAFFGSGWLLAGLGHFGGTTTVVAGMSGLVVASALVLIARRQASLPGDQVSPPLQPLTRRRFRQVNALQWSLIAAAAAGCVAGGVPVLFMPLVAVVVGLHFHPLARVFSEVRLVAPGVLLTAIGIAGLFVRAAGASPGTVYTLVGVGSALTLWSTAVWALAGARLDARRQLVG